jgi:BASS family bile acid:Na+ symporter
MDGAVSPLGRVGQAGEWIADHIAPIAIAAVIAALLVPWHALARRSDLLLAALVLFTALQINPRDLHALRGRMPVIAVIALSVVLVLTGVAWLISRGFDGQVRDGILSLGLASTEVASVGLIGLAGGDSVLGLGILTASLICSAILGPVLAGLLAHTTGPGGSLSLLGRFSLVVLAPLAAGLLLRGRQPALKRAEGSLNGLAAVTVCLLLYAAVSNVHGGHRLAQEILGSAAFMIASAALGLLLSQRLRTHALDPGAVAFTTGLRDFAVAAALATQAFSPAAASVGGIYGALMLLAGALAATWMRRRSPHPRLV